MEQLIHALFTYCQVGRQHPAFAAINSETLLEQTVADLHEAITESGAMITHDPLPTVRADGGHLRQVLRHLLSNALKFRSSAPPCVHLLAQRQGPQWVFAVQDNGIGLDPQQAARIFQIFQRLHTRDQYPGTGIGLAICKKIVEQHGGVCGRSLVRGRARPSILRFRRVPPTLRRRGWHVSTVAASHRSRLNRTPAPSTVWRKPPRACRVFSSTK